MTNRLGQALRDARNEIADAWSQRVKQSSEHYRSLPLEDIQPKSLAIVDALAVAVSTGDYTVMQDCLFDLAQERASRGFESAEMQRAMLMGCETMFPYLDRAAQGDAQILVWFVTQVERAIHRSITLLNQALDRVTLDSLTADLTGMRARHERAEARLQALLSALGHGLVAVNEELIVTWADERAGEARCGLIGPGEAIRDVPTCASAGELLLAAVQSGEVQEAPPGATCDVWLAIPVAGPDGALSEVLGVMGPPTRGMAPPG